VFDRSPQIGKLRLDLETATTNAEQCGVEPADVVLELLKRADQLSQIAAERGADMSKLEGILS
jgi:hypothetical protein